MTTTSSAVRQLSDQNSQGTLLGASATDLIGFYGVTAIAQRSGAAQAAVSTTAATATSPWGFSTSTQANAVVTLLNELRASMVALGLVKGS